MISYSKMSRDDADRSEQTELPHLVADDSDDGSCSSIDFQTYDELDLYIYDNNPVPSFDRDMGFTDLMSTICPDFEFLNPDMIIETTNRDMILPFLEETVEASNIPNDDSFEESMLNFEDACFYLEFHQMNSEQESEISSGLDVLKEMECIDQQLFFGNFPYISETITPLPIWIPMETQKRKSVTLVLDLDETLVHSTLEHCEDADFTFSVFFDLKDHIVYVRRRPYLQVFLERVAEMFDVVIFTAGQSIYAERLLDILDPNGNLITRRIYRDSCIFSNGSYTKDLSILGVDLAKVAIIDNTPQVFRLQVNNGIPIESWFHDPSDQALISLLPFLETLVHVDDVRPIIAERFANKESFGQSLA